MAGEDHRSEGRGLDRLGIKTPGPIALSFISAYLPADQEQYVSYTTRVRTGGGNTVTQAAGENTGQWTELAAGEYSYKFLTKAPATIDRTATHTIGAHGSRNLAEFELATNYADTTFHFVPSGGAVTRCGHSYRDVQQVPRQVGWNTAARAAWACVSPHTPIEGRPTLNTADFKVMVHKIHYGENCRA